MRQRHLERRDARQNRADDDERQNALSRAEEERRDLGIGDDHRSGARHCPSQQEQRSRREERKRNQLVDEVGLGKHAPGIAQVPDRTAYDGLSRFPHGCPASIGARRNKLNRRAPERAHAVAGRVCRLWAGEGPESSVRSVC